MIFCLFNDVFLESFLYSLANAGPKRGMCMNKIVLKIGLNNFWTCDISGLFKVLIRKLKKIKSGAAHFVA